jgi:pyruvate carboxylase subunit B
VRAELGSPPLVTPVTEMIATQAVYNVVEGDRYATITQEVKDYFLGLYGEPPLSVDADIRRLVNGRQEPITCRPADLIEPAVRSARRELKREGVTPTEPGVATYVLFPSDYLALVRGELVAERLGDEPAPAVEPAVHEVDADATPDAAVAGSLEPQIAETERNVRELTVEVDGQAYAVRVIGAADSPTPAIPTAAQTAGPPPVREGTVIAPMQGLLLKVPVREGDAVHLGDVVAVLEAMKMQNDITATRSGTVTHVYVKEGDVVSVRDPLVHIG